MQRILELIRQLDIDEVAFCAILSVLSLYFLPERFLFCWQLCLLLFSLLLIMRLAIKKPQFIIKWINRILILLVFIGYAHFIALNSLQQAQIFPQKIQTTFRIVEIHHQGDYQSLVLQTEQPNRRIYATWKVSQSPKLGELWQGELQLRPISSRLNISGFDRQIWYFAKDIQAWGTVKSAVKITQDFSWREQRLADSLMQTQGLTQQGLLLALGFGERAWLNPDTWKIYQQTNTAHLIAISGLHIGLAMALGFCFGRVVQYMLPTPKITPIFPLCCGVVSALFYANLAGFAIPTLRASIALLILILLHFYRAYCTAWQLYFRIVAVLLLYDPLMILSTSFWLSIGAVGCLILWYQLFPLHLLRWRGLPLSSKVRWILALFHLQLGLFCLFTPIQLAFFNGFSLQGFWANLLIVPLYSFLLVPVVLFAVFSNGSLYSWRLADFVADKITDLLSLFQHGWLSLSYLQSAYFNTLLAFLIWGMLYKIYTSNRKNISYHKKPRCFSLKSDRSLSPILYARVQKGILLFILANGLQPLWHYFNQSDWQIDTLDVGQGLATLIVKNQRGILYDTGASWQGGSMAELEIIPYLQRQGITLDYLIISHDDNDHAGGARAILQAFPQAMLVSPSQKNYSEKHRTFCQAEKQWLWQGIQIKVLSPKQIVERADNFHSCVLWLEKDKHSLLLTGDADIATERQILPLLNKVEVLQVGHHGSKTSTGQGFVNKLQPDIALISSGRWNPWHFPNRSVMERLQQAQSAVYNTAISGQISVRFYAEQTKVVTARNAFSPWYQQIIDVQHSD
ncbi:DNA internalization-related competence protein ComEC/Rec2 [Lonepinella sp. MS14437]|uniref:DNA internalization-related competence protein ComEC/Rec2 n=1 Tax=Lonepinella sp. MS14437 TaxID=3003620 RepID=UPI0036D9F4F1